MEVNNGDLSQMDVETKDNKKLKKIILFLVIVIIVALSGLMVFKELTKENETKENQIKKYKLVKYADFNEKISRVSDANFFEDYFVFTGYNRNTSEDYLGVFKNGQKVDVESEFEMTNIRRIGKLNKYFYRYYNNGRAIKYALIDISGNNSINEAYDYIGNYDGVLLVSKNNKYGIIDADGKIIVDLIYDDLQNHNVTNNYYFAQLNGKAGVINSNGKIIIPIEYDCPEEPNEYDYFDYGNIIEDEKVFFRLRLNNENVVLDDKNNALIKDKRNIEYNNIINYFIIKKPNTRKYEYYSTDGTFIKEIDYDAQSFGSNYGTGFGREIDFKIFSDKNNDSTVYLLDKNLNVTKYDDVYYHTGPEGMDMGEGLGEAIEKWLDYYISKNVYVTYDGKKYYLKSIKDKSTINSYSFIDYVNFSDVDDMFVACKEEKSCGLIDSMGKEITKFNYELISFLEYSDRVFYTMLKNSEDTIVLTSKKWLKVTCNSNSELTNGSIETVGNFLFYNKYFYNNKCEIITEKEISDYEYLDNGFIVAEIEETEKEINGQEVHDHYIFDNNGKQVNYENPDDALMYLFLAYNDNKIYFLTDKGIYYLTNY